MDREPGIYIGAGGFLATVTLADLNALVAVLVGLATLGFVITRWAFFVQSRGGFASLFVSPSQAAQRSDDSQSRRPPPDPLD